MSTGEKQNKLTITPGQGKGKKFKFDSNNQIAICFNPSEYSLDKKNTFAEKTIPGLESPLIQFSHGNGRSLTLELMLDTYTSTGNENVNDKYIKPLEKLVNIDGQLHAPPPCQVLWGDLNFVGVVESLNKKYILFSKDGRPVRARVTLTMKEYIPLDIQEKSPPRSSPDRRKALRVKEGDTLSYLSYEAYGTPEYWRMIAEANNIDNPRNLDIGKLIIIPELDQEKAGS